MDNDYFIICLWDGLSHRTPGDHLGRKLEQVSAILSLEIRLPMKSIPKMYLLLQICLIISSSIAQNLQSGLPTQPWLLYSLLPLSALNYCISLPTNSAQDISAAGSGAMNGFRAPNLDITLLLTSSYPGIQSSSTARFLAKLFSVLQHSRTTMPCSVKPQEVSCCQSMCTLLRLSSLQQIGRR